MLCLYVAREDYTFPVLMEDQKRWRTVFFVNSLPSGKTIPAPSNRKKTNSRISCNMLWPLVVSDGLKLKEMDVDRG